MLVQSLPVWWPWALVGAGGVMALAGGLWRQTSQYQRLREAVEDRTRTLEQASRRYRLMVDNAYDLTCVLDADGRIDYANAAYARVLGYMRDELKGRYFGELVHIRDGEAIKPMVDAALNGKTTGNISLRIRPKDGNGWVTVEAVAKALPDADWQVRQVVIHAHNITAHRRAQDELRANESRFRDFAASSADWLWETDAAGVLVYVSPGVMGVLGCSPESLLGQDQTDVLFHEDINTTRELIQSRIERKESYRDLEFWTKSVSGERVCLRVSGVPVLDENQQLKGYRGAVSNITASKLDRENMYRMATSDHLTGLLNRTRFKEELERAVSLSKHHNTRGVMMFIDLDRFKEINDTHGHEAGDRILQEVAQILRQHMRSTDVVARLGGDEFGIIMHNIDLPTAEDKVNRIIERVKALVVPYNGAKLTTTMSIGMVQYPQDDRSVDHLIMSADLAMYRAKDMGRNRLFVDDENATSETVISVRDQLKWVDRLKVCLETGDFQMHYQCIVPAQKHQRPLFEALLRIYDVDGKVVSPALYIDAAEHFGLIQQLDLAVTQRVFETQKQLIKDNVACDISINLSCRSLGDAVVMEKLKELLDKTKIDPNRIVFEVTETMALHDPSQMRDVGEIKAFTTELRRLGFRFALDDFGSGFTSFRYLRVLDVDIVKIDGEYVKSIVSNTEDKLFVKHMAELCRGLGIMTIAEFVEDEPIRDVLLELDIDYGQGWLFAKPVPDIKAACAQYQGKIMAEFKAAPPSAKPVAAVAPVPVVKAMPQKTKSKGRGKKAG